MAAVLPVAQKFLQYAPAVIGKIGEGKAAASGISTELIGYDFIGLLVKVTFFQVVALLIAKYIEFTAGVDNIILRIGAFFGWTPPRFPLQQVIDFYQNGWNGIMYWDLVKMASVAIVLIELNNYVESQKKLGGEPSAATVGVFLLIVGFFLMITIPEMVQRIKDAQAMTPGATTNEPSI